MNNVGIFVSYQFYERGLTKCIIFMMSKGNKVNFTHIIVNCMGKRHVDFFLKNASPLLNNRAYCMTPIFKERG